MYLPGIEIAETVGFGVGVGVEATGTDGDGDADAVAIGDGDGDAVLEAVGDGEGDAVFVAVGDAVGVGETVGVGDGDAVLVAVGVGDAVGVAFVKLVGVPEPGQVCERRIPESTPLIFASEPTCTIRIRSETRVYAYAPLPLCTHAPVRMVKSELSCFIKTKFKFTAASGLSESCWNVAPRVVKTKCQASYPCSKPGR
jgi:hypothetical protein